MNQRFHRLRPFLLLVFVAVSLLVAGGWSASMPVQEDASVTADSAAAISRELKDMFETDQAERRERRMDANRDRQRLSRARELLLKGQLQTPDDYFHAAMIFQHSLDRTGRDHLISHVLATVAAFEGHQGARWLTAAALDRSLQFSGHKQFFGTQSRRNKNGEWVGGDFDKHRTEALRRAYGVR